MSETTSQGLRTTLAELSTHTGSASGLHAVA